MKSFSDLNETETLRFSLSQGHLREAAFAFAIRPDHHNSVMLYCAAHEFSLFLAEVGLQDWYREVVVGSTSCQDAK